jgi:hypothetical protein
MLQRHAWAADQGAPHPQFPEPVSASVGEYDLSLTRRDPVRLPDVTARRWIWQNGSAADDAWGPSVVIGVRARRLLAVTCP